MKLYEDDDYHFTLKLRETVDKNVKTFLNFTFIIEDLHGNQLSKGDLSLCVVWCTEIERIEAITKGYVYSDGG